MKLLYIISYTVLAPTLKELFRKSEIMNSDISVLAADHLFHIIRYASNVFNLISN